MPKTSGQASRYDIPISSNSKLAGRVPRPVTIILNLNLNKPVITLTKRREWRNYSKELLCAELKSKDWSIKLESVQAWCDIIENNIIAVVCAIVSFLYITHIRQTCYNNLLGGRWIKGKDNWAKIKLKKI